MQMKKTAAWLPLLLLLCCLAPSGAAQEENAFRGYFEGFAYIRETPAMSDHAVATIPPETPVYLTPVNEKYAAVEYNGAQGYVYYKSAKSMPKETPVAPFTAYCTGRKYLLDAPLSGASTLQTLPAETPVTVVATAGTAYYKITAGETEGYIHRRDMEALPSEEPISPREVYAAAAIAARVLPLKGAQEVYTLAPRQVYQAVARCRGYWKLAWGTGEGYVPIAETTALSADSASVRVGLLAPEAALYAYPDASLSQPVRTAPEQARLYFLDGVNHGFYHLAELDAYAAACDVQTYALASGASQLFYIESETPLRLGPQTDAAPAGVSLPQSSLCTAAYQVDGWLLVQAQGQWGFAEKSALRALRLGQAMNRTAAVVKKDTVFYYESGENIPISAASKLFIERTAESFYQANFNGRIGYVSTQDIRLIGSDAPLDKYVVAAPADIRLMDFPDRILAEEFGLIPAGTEVIISAFNRCYLLVQARGNAALTGYAPADGLITAETEGMPRTEEQPRYELALDKAARMIFAFVLDEEGQRTGKIAAQAQIAIGKRTTPTPSGEFILGKKERWHRFSQSYTPHTVVYTAARYLHGLPCHQKSEATVIDFMAHNAGQAVTGGCLRCPFDFARWIYFNCPSYQTKLTIVNGGLAPTPAPTAAPAPSPVPENSPLPQ